MRRWLVLLIWAISTYGVLCLAIAFFLAEITFHPYRRHLPVEAKTEVQHAISNLQTRLIDVAVEAQNQAVLRAWLIQPQHRNGCAVILLHGLGDNRLGTVGYAELMLAHGYTVLMPDARAHGESGGDLATYGIIERDDIRRWFEWLGKTVHPTCVFGLGESMGAAQLLQSLAVEPHFCGVVAESSFSSFREIAYDRMGQRFGSGPWIGRTVLRPVVEISLLVARMKYHVDLRKASPEDAVAQTHTPVLLIHGIVDSNIPLRHSIRLMTHNSQLTLWEVPGADHCGAISVAPQEFEQRVVTWFEMHKSLPPPERSSHHAARMKVLGMKSLGHCVLPES